MRIAILGSRGIPARYSGFETCAEELSKKLSERGHEVSVYCCQPYSITNAKYFQNVKRIILPTVRMKSLEKLLYSVFCLMHVAFTRNEIVLMLGINIPILFIIPRIFKKKIAINVDGLEWKRKKWGWFATKYLFFSERIAGCLAHKVITDAKCIQSYYLKSYGIKSSFIPYGIKIITTATTETLNKFNLEKDGYILYVSRFAPENNPLLVKEAFEQVSTPSMKLVMVGDSPFDKEYVKSVKNTKNPNIIFTNAIYGNGYQELLSNAYFYIQATEVGGTHPALVEAMGSGNFVLANDVPEHREVLRDAGMYYRGKKDLSKKIEMLMNNPDIIQEGRIKAKKISQKEYTWEKVCDSYENLFKEIFYH